jgi:hypothetical protein
MHGHLQLPTLNGEGDPRRASFQQAGANPAIHLEPDFLVEEDALLVHALDGCRDVHHDVGTQRPDR